MNAPSTKTVLITPKTTEKTTLSSAQKRFNSLTKKIDVERNRLIEWQEITHTYHQKINNEYEPLLNELIEAKTQWVLLLDEAYDNSVLTKTDKQKLHHILSEYTQELIAEFERYELKPLFNKYNEFDYDEMFYETQSEMSDLMKEMVENMFNVELDEDADISSPENFKAHLQEKLREKLDAQPQQWTQTQEPPPERKKTKKQLEKELRLQEEEALALQSVREVYRKLAAVLHPDREQDFDERIRKTELMQRVNAAYGKKDLLKLLELQLEIEQIDAQHLTQIADSRLKYFNKILKEQLEELNHEVEQIEGRFKVMLNIPYYASLSPKQLIYALNRDIKEVKEESGLFKTQLESFQNPTALKAWLKKYKLPKKQTQEDFYFEDFSPFNFR